MATFHVLRCRKMSQLFGAAVPVFIPPDKQAAPVLVPVEAQQVDEELLHALPARLGNMNIKAVEFAADHLGSAPNQDPFLLVNFFTLEQFDTEASGFTGLLDPLVAVPADPGDIRFMAAPDPDIALVVRPEQVG